MHAGPTPSLLPQLAAVVVGIESDQLYHIARQTGYDINRCVHQGL